MSLENLSHVIEPKVYLAQCWSQSQGLGQMHADNGHR